MASMCAVTLVLTLSALCVGSPFGAWTFQRRFHGHAFPGYRRSSFSAFASPPGRFSRANARYDTFTFGGFPQGRSVDSAVEAVDEPVAALSEAGADAAPVSFEALAAEQPSASEAPSIPAPVAEESFAVEDSQASPSPQEPPTLPSSPAVEPEAEDSSIFFPGHQTPVEPKAGDVFVPECDGVPFMALNQETGRCQFLMMRTECPEGQWFILDRDTREASCQPLPCPETEVLFEGKCMPRDDASLCPEGMVLLANEYGDSSCDCTVKHLYWPAHDRCYPAYRRGPCNAGNYLTVTEEDGVRCTENVCFRDGAALWKPAKRCYRLQDESDSPCALGRLDVNEDTLELECVETEPFAIFDLPVVRCSKGSKLDYGGRCKRELYQKFRSSFTSGATRTKRCGEGFILGASGRCLKAAAAEDSALG